MFHLWAFRGYSEIQRQTSEAVPELQGEGQDELGYQSGLGLSISFKGKRMVQDGLFFREYWLDRGIILIQKRCRG
jgi:hypothetical protein